MSDAKFDAEFLKLLKCFISRDIEAFTEAYSNFEKTLTPEEKIQSLYKNIKLNLHKENYDLAIKACDKIIEIATENEITSNF